MALKEEKKPLFGLQKKIRKIIKKERKKEIRRLPEVKNPNFDWQPRFTNGLVHSESQCKKRTQIKPKGFNWDSKELEEEEVI